MDSNPYVRWDRGLEGPSVYQFCHSRAATSSQASNSATRDLTLGRRDGRIPLSGGTGVPSEPSGFEKATVTSGLFKHVWNKSYLPARGRLGEFANGTAGFFFP